MKTVLLTLGRLPKALELARALRAAGARVLVAEPFLKHLTGTSRAVERSFVVTAPVVDRQRYLDDLRAIIARERVDIVVPVSEEILHVAGLHGSLPDGCELRCMPQQALLEVHDKGRFVAVCRAAGVGAPETCDANAAEARQLAAQHDYVVKPVSSCSGRGVQFFARGAALPATAEPSIVQRRVQGELLSTFSIARAGELCQTVVYRGAVMQGTVAVCFERVEPSAAVHEWVRRFVAHTRFDGFVSFDLIVDASGVVYGIECNPRATSGIHFVAPEGLAMAVLDPAMQRPIALRPERMQQQFYPCLTETQKSMFSAGFRHNLRCLLEAREVTWARTDPWPFIAMPYTAWNIIVLAARHRATFGEVAMLDFAWVASGRA